MIVRNKPDKHFSVIKNAPAERTDMSLKAKGLYYFLMTKPDGWKVSVRGLESQLKESKEAIISALKELEKLGYYRKVRTRDNLGHFKYEDNMYDYPCPGNQDAGNQDPGNPPLVNTDKVKTEREKTERNPRARLNSGLAPIKQEIRNSEWYRKSQLRDAYESP